MRLPAPPQMRVYRSPIERLSYAAGFAREGGAGVRHGVMPEWPKGLPC